MMSIHDRLKARHGWYERWHAHAYSNAITWGIFLVFSLLTTLVIVGSIQDSVLALDAELQMSAVAFSQRSDRRTVPEIPEVARIRALTTEALRMIPSVRSDTVPATELERILRERQTLIRTTARAHPTELKSVLLDEAGVRAFPESVRSLLEQPFKKSGTYRIAIVTTEQPDADLGTHEHGYEEYFLEVSDKERYQLFLTHDEAYAIAPETTATVTGVDLGDDVIVPTQPLEEGGWDGEGEVLGISTVKKVAVIGFIFQDTTTTPSLTADVIKQRVFTNTNSVKAYFKDASYGFLDMQGKNNVDGDVFAWVTIPVSTNGTCSYSTWASEANKVVEAQGNSLTGYTNIQYVFPGKNTGCGWSGLAYIGSMTSTSRLTSWVKAESLGTFVSGHELGHNFGFHHSGKYNCDVAVNTSPSTCSSSEYGDRYDIMGGSAKHTNGFNKAKGWLNPEQMVTVTQSGTYTLEPAEAQTGGVKFLRIKRPFTSSLGTFSDGYYQIEQRARIGTFGTNASSSNPALGVQVRLVGDYLAGGARNTFLVRPLLPGESLNDTEAGITITLTGATEANATVEITKVGPPCVRNAPTVTVTPPSKSVEAGAQVSYTVSVRNNDGEGCATGTFGISMTLPDGFTQSPDPVSLTIDPAMSKTATINVLSSFDATVGSYSIPVTVTHDAMGSSVTVISSYSIIPPDDALPSVSITAPAEGAVLSGTRNTISVSASDQSGIARIEIAVDGTTMSSCTNATTCSYNLSTRKMVSGNHTITATAVDASSKANTNTATITVSIGGTTSGGGGGGKGNGKP